MANTKRELFLKRRLRVRNKIKATAHGRLRLSVHRSSKNISVQLIDDGVDTEPGVGDGHLGGLRWALT